MGYVESAQYFCAVSKTVADLANDTTQQRRPHPLKRLAETNPPECDPAARGVLTDINKATLEQYFRRLPKDEIAKCLDYVDVYIDNFVALCQSTKAMQRASTRRLFHNIDEVFRANDANNTSQRESNSIKKLKKGRMFFHSQKNPGLAGR